MELDHVNFEKLGLAAMCHKDFPRTQVSGTVISAVKTGREEAQPAVASGTRGRGGGED